MDIDARSREFYTGSSWEDLIKHAQKHVPEYLIGCVHLTINGHPVKKYYDGVRLWEDFSRHRKLADPELKIPADKIEFFTLPLFQTFVTQDFKSHISKINNPFSQNLIPLEFPQDPREANVIVAAHKYTQLNQALGSCQFVYAGRINNDFKKRFPWLAFAKKNNPTLVPEEFQLPDIQRLAKF